MEEPPRESVRLRFRRLAGAVSGCLATEGYCARGQTFWHSTPHLRRVIILWRSRWNTANECSFAFTLGIFVPKFHESLTGLPDPAYPTSEALAISLGIDQIPHHPPTKRTISWELTDSNSHRDAKIQQQVLKELRDYVLPFLGRFTTLSDVIDYLLWVRSISASHPQWRPTRPNDVWLPVYLAVLWSLSGDKTEAQREIEFALSSVHGSYFREKVLAIRERLFSSR